MLGAGFGMLLWLPWCWLSPQHKVCGAGGTRQTVSVLHLLPCSGRRWIINFGQLLAALLVLPLFCCVWCSLPCCRASPSGISRAEGGQPRCGLPAPSPQQSSMWPLKLLQRLMNLTGDLHWPWWASDPVGGVLAGDVGPEQPPAPHPAAGSPAQHMPVGSRGVCVAATHGSEPY